MDMDKNHSLKLFWFCILKFFKPYMYLNKELYSEVVAPCPTGTHDSDSGFRTLSLEAQTSVNSTPGDLYKKKA